MLASVWLPLLVAGTVFLSLVVASVATAGYLVWRYGMRRWRLLRSHDAVIGAGLLWTAVTSRFVRPAPPRSPAEMMHWSTRTVRREMWRAVDRAEAAVRTADDLGGPTASLPFLCRRLRQASIGLDRILRVGEDGAPAPELAAQAFDVIRAADDVQRAAVASAGHATGQHVESLTRDADQEMAALEAGLASARALGVEPEG